MCMPTDRVYGVKLSGLGLNLIERFIEYHTVVGQ